MKTFLCTMCVEYNNTTTELLDEVRIQLPNLDDDELWKLLSLVIDDGRRRWPDNELWYI